MLFSSVIGGELCVCKANMFLAKTAQVAKLRNKFLFSRVKLAVLLPNSKNLGWNVLLLLFKLMNPVAMI